MSRPLCWPQVKLKSSDGIGNEVGTDVMTVVATVVVWVDEGVIKGAMVGTNWGVKLLVEGLLELNVAAALSETACAAWLIWHLPSFPGRQVSHFFPALAHEQFLQLPVVIAVNVALIFYLFWGEREKLSVLLFRTYSTYRCFSDQSRSVLCISVVIDQQGD